MGINVYLQDVNGVRQDHVYDLHNSVVKLWPIADDHFPLLQYIDPYGNVIFNGSQMSEVLVELNTLMTMASTTEQRDVIRGVIDLAIRCQRSPHTFLRFRGD